MKQWNRTILPAMLLVLFAGSILLGFLQQNWIQAAGQSDMENLYRTLNSETSRAIQEARDEMEIISPLFSAYFGGNVSSTSLSEIIQIWEQNAVNSDLIEQIFIVDKSNPDTLQAIDFTKSSIIRQPFPDELNFLSKTDGRGQVDLQFENVMRLMGMGYTFQLLYDEPVHNANRSDEIRPPLNRETFILIKINQTILYESVLPYYLERYLEDYSISIKPADSPKPEDMKKESDLLIHFSSNLNPSYRDIYKYAIKNFDGEIPDNISFSVPGISRWIGRREDITLQGMPEPEQPEIPNDASQLYTLSINHIDSSIHDIIIRKTRTETVLSFTIILFLNLALWIAFILYRQSRKVHLREQEFVTSVSHELRTPITVINASADNLAAGTVKTRDRIQKYGKEILVQSDRLGKMIEGILLYSGLDQKLQTTKPQTRLNIYEFTEQLIETLKAPAEREGASLIFMSEPREGTILTDETALQIILENLILNAIFHGKLSKNDKANQMVKVYVQSELYTSKFIIEDTGPGIPQSEQKKIFTPFYRGKQSKEEHHRGSGLGLHLVEKVVKTLKGKIRLESPYLNTNGTLETGCRVTVSLPTEWR